MGRDWISSLKLTINMGEVHSPSKPLAKTVQELLSKHVQVFSVELVALTG